VTHEQETDQTVTEIDENGEETHEEEQQGLSFEELGLAPKILEALEPMGIVQPTDVQIEAIPLAFKRRDMLVQSRTGTGKTLAFGAPIIQGMIGLEPKTRALVLAPTRELALQVANECARIAACTDVGTVAIYGGAAMGPQIDALKAGTQIVVGTPGRVLDHIRRRTFDTSSISTLVLDEGDEMLSMGFLEEIKAIIDSLPEERHTMVFSATIPEDIQRLADRYTRDAARLYLSEDYIGVREVQHVYYLVTGGDRHGDLLRVLKVEQPETAIIFCNTRDDTANVAGFLQSSGFAAEGISSDLTQFEREKVMGKMRANELTFLVATDIAARGIDLSDLSHVINYTFPESPDVYIHRTGRTGRAGKSGVAVSLVSPREIGSFYYLKLIHKIVPEERHLPSADEIATNREAARHTRLMEICAGRDASEELRRLARRVWSTVDGERLMALALSHVLEEPGEVFAAIEVRPPRPAEPRDESARPSSPRRDSRDRDGRGDRGRLRRDGGRDRDSRGRSSRDRGPRREGGDRGPRREGGDRGPRREGGDRGPRREGGDRGPRREGGDRRPRREGGDRGPRRDEGDRAPRPEAAEHEPLQEATGESNTSPRASDRKTTRTRRRDSESGRDSEPGRDSEQGAFTTPDGDVEYWETVDGGGQGGGDDTSVRLFMNIGRQQGLGLSDLFQLVQDTTGLGKDQVARVQIKSSYSFFNVAGADADAVLEKLNGKTFAERDVRVERAKTGPR